MLSGLKFQIILNICSWILQYLEILNLYNCEKYWCSGTHFIYTSLTLLNYIIFKYDNLIFIPSLIIGLIGSLSLFFWDLTWWNISTRYRTEYYDTHCFYTTILFINLFWCFFYIYTLKRYLVNLEKLTNLFYIESDNII